MILLGFDFGTKYLGVAVGQTITKSATPLTSLKVEHGIPKWEEIQKLIDEWKPEKLIVGIPLNMDGTKQDITYACEKFAIQLREQFKLEVFPIDERLSTWEAKVRFKEQSAKSTSQQSGKGAAQSSQSKSKFSNKTKSIQTKDKNTLKQINALAAVILVEQWMNENL